MPSLTAEQFFKQGMARFKPQPVDVPELEGDVYVRVLNGLERDQFEAGFISESGDQLPKAERLRNFRGRLVTLCACDGGGNRIFSDAHAEQVGRMPAPILDRIYEVAARINRLSNDDVKELVGNSDAGQPVASTSDSHATSAA